MSIQIVQFENGRFGIRRWRWLNILTGCPYEFLKGYTVHLDPETYATHVFAKGWVNKVGLIIEDTYLTKQKAEEVLTTYKANVAKAAEIVKARTFNCGTPV